MFAKPYKLKSNNTLKNSEKKQLVQRIKNEFPSASEERIKELLPVKSVSSWMRLVLHGGEPAGVLVVEGRPVMLELREQLVPTVCALWALPELLPTITIQTLVLAKVAGGAPLYVPGVVTGAAGAGLPLFARGQLLAARTTDNAAAALVGRAAMPSVDMLLRTSGVCLDTIHVMGDLLCQDPKFVRIERPTLTPAAQPPAPPAPDARDPLVADLRQLNLQPPDKEEWPALGRPAPPSPAPPPPPAPAHPALNQPRVIPDTQTESNDTQEDQDQLLDQTEAEQSEECESGAPRDMDGLLRWCLLSFLRLHSKTLQLPLKTNLLYKNHMFAVCPPDRTLDVKKSSYKKMGKFLEAMQLEGLVEVREVEKGVSAVTAVNVAHPAVRAHRPPALAPAPAPAAAREEREYLAPQVRDVLCVTAAVADIFPGVKKGTALTGGEARAALTEYVRARNLAASEQRGAVTLDATLAKILGKPIQECVGWEDVWRGVVGRMTAATLLQFAGGADRLVRTRIEPVRMHTVTRSGNKKVTLVSNLEAYGFHLGSLSRACQLGVGAACGVTRSPGAKHDQLMLQGDQTHFVAKLLIEKYGLPKKFVEDADKALNKKK